MSDLSTFVSHFGAPRLYVLNVNYTICLFFFCLHFRELINFSNIWPCCVAQKFNYTLLKRERGAKLSKTVKINFVSELKVFFNVLSKMLSIFFLLPNLRHVFGKRSYLNVLSKMVSGKILAKCSIWC